MTIDRSFLFLWNEMLRLHWSTLQTDSKLLQDTAQKLQSELLCLQPALELPSSAIAHLDGCFRIADLRRRNTPRWIQSFLGNLRHVNLGFDHWAEQLSPALLGLHLNLHFNQTSLVSFQVQPSPVTPNFLQYQALGCKQPLEAYLTHNQTPTHLPSALGALSTPGGDSIQSYHGNNSSHIRKLVVCPWTQSPISLSMTLERVYKDDDEDAGSVLPCGSKVKGTDYWIQLTSDDPQSPWFAKAFSQRDANYFWLMEDSVLDRSSFLLATPSLMQWTQAQHLPNHLETYGHLKGLMLLRLFLNPKVDLCDVLEMPERLIQLVETALAPASIDSYLHPSQKQLYRAPSHCATSSDLIRSHQQLRALLQRHHEQLLQEQQRTGVC